jgi:hypothetical protein
VEKQLGLILLVCGLKAQVATNISAEIAALPCVRQGGARNVPCFLGVPLFYRQLTLATGAGSGLVNKA